MVWHLISSTLDRGDKWVMFTFRRRAKGKLNRGQLIIYYHHEKPELTHVGMVARRKGDPRLIAVAEAAIAYQKLMDGEFKGFTVKHSLVTEGDDHAGGHDLRSVALPQ